MVIAGGNREFITTPSRVISAGLIDMVTFQPRLENMK